MCGTSKVYCTSNLTGPKAHNIIYINTFALWNQCWIFFFLAISEDYCLIFFLGMWDWRRRNKDKLEENTGKKQSENANDVDLPFRRELFKVKRAQGPICSVAERDAFDEISWMRVPDNGFPFSECFSRHFLRSTLPHSHHFFLFFLRKKNSISIHSLISCDSFCQTIVREGIIET